MESIKTKAELIRLFLKYPISSIIIVDEKERVIGFISRQDIIASSGRQADISISIEEVIKHHLNPVNEEDISSLKFLLRNFARIKRIPIMDRRGNIVDMWERFHVITAWEGEVERADSYSKIFDHFPAGVVITSAEHKIVYLNQVASSLSNVKGKKVGRNFIDVFNVQIEAPALKKEEGGMIFDAGYIKEDRKIKGIIYIINKK